ncbi:hypothetical protein [Candidatus Viridilinea mediisalina]|uniref:Uncharacterized protein n=1 Tax=Candidatus Viridilinea mediisalina TaxID=2024553 RepID=A0A2A6RFL8_9CHLR|nr:hypothetical protein [Candidatus Viridilinea mediisalina]PDW01924.1 hypothetical protein CJ255_16670 [Candidatus Viridilinea mediisalina]
MKRNSSALRSIPQATPGRTPGFGRGQVPSTTAISRLEQERARLEQELTVWRTHEARVSSRIAAIDAQLARLRHPAGEPAAPPPDTPTPAPEGSGGMVFEY